MMILIVQKQSLKEVKSLIHSVGKIYVRHCARNWHCTGRPSVSSCLQRTDTLAGR